MLIPALFKSVMIDRAISLFILVLVVAMFPIQAECKKIEAQLDFSLPVPVDETQKQALGLSMEGQFFLGQIDADFVIIEIFSMYCPICQREAPNVNKLYRLIQGRPALKNRVTLIGIGAGNSPFEVNFFKEKYDIKFPLFSDPDFTIHKKIKNVRTPHFFGLLMQEDKKFKIVYSQSGEVSNPEVFLKTLLDTSELHIQP